MELNQELLKVNIPNSRTKEHIQQYNKQYRQDHQEYIKGYRIENKDNTAKYNKMYYQNHKEYHQKYHKDNYEKIKQRNQKRNAETIVCNVCNATVKRGSFISHKKSMKHIKALNETKKENTCMPCFVPIECV